MIRSETRGSATICQTPRPSPPVSIDGGRIRFALPQPFEQALSITVEFDGATLKATGKDLFIDYWEKVSWESRRENTAAA
jgi:hypothetical protein